MLYIIIFVSYSFYTQYFVLLNLPPTVLPPSLTPLPTGNHFLCICEAVSVLLYSFIFFIFYIPNISENIQYFSFSVWLTSLSIIPSRSICVAANVKTFLFLWLSSIPLCVYITSYLSIYLLLETGCLHIFTIINSVPTDVEVHISSLTRTFSSGIYPGVELLGRTVVLFSVFWGISPWC